MVTLRDILTVILDQHKRLNPGEMHGVEFCSVCLVIAALGVVLESAGLTLVEAKPLASVPHG